MAGEIFLAGSYELELWVRVDIAWDGVDFEFENVRCDVQAACFAGKGGLFGRGQGGGEGADWGWR